MFNGPEPTEIDPSRIRDIALLPGETVNHVFSPTLGLTQEPSVNGQLLIATNRRILAFCRNDGRNETYLVPVTELKAVAVQTRSRNFASIIQGTLLLLGGVFLYLAIAYWLAGRFHGPGVPWINMDIVPLLILIIGLAGAVAVVRHYFTKEDGSVTFQGVDWRFEFPYRGERAGQDLYQVVNSVFATHNSAKGRLYLWED